MTLLELKSFHSRPNKTYKQQSCFPSESLNVLALFRRCLISVIAVGSAPGERPPHHLKEQLVGLPEVVTELPEGLGAQWCMRSAFRLVQALVMSSRQEAVEAFGGVVVEVVWADPRRQVQKPLCLSQLGEGITNECVTVHHVYLLPGEDLQPAGQVQVVQAPLHRFVCRVNVALVEQELL